MHPLLEFVILLCKICYYYVEAFVRVFKPPPKKGIRGSKVLVTGGGRGIGRELAVAFSKQDTDIVLWDIDKDGLKETAEDLRIRGVKVHTYVCDVTSKENVKKTAECVRKDVGDIDILVNNAGILNGKYITDLEEKDVRRAYEVNTISHFWTVQEFLPAMIQRRTGHIVTIASMAAKVGSPMLVDYCASKFAAYGFTEALRMELRSKWPHVPIYTTTVCPMFVKTNLICGEEFTSRVSYKDRFGKLLEAREVAESVVDGVLKNDPVVYVPSDASNISFVNAYVLDIITSENKDLGYFPRRQDWQCLISRRRASSQPIIRLDADSTRHLYRRCWL